VAIVGNLVEEVTALGVVAGGAIDEDKKMGKEGPDHLSKRHTTVISKTEFMGNFYNRRLIRALTLCHRKRIR